MLGASDQPEQGEKNDRADNRSDQAVNGNTKQAEKSHPPINAGDNADDDVAEKAKAAAVHICPAIQPATTPITKKMMKPTSVMLLVVPP